MAWLRGVVPPLSPSTYPVKDVVKAVRAGDIKAEEQDAGVGVEEGPQAVIVNLPWESGGGRSRQISPNIREVIPADGGAGIRAWLCASWSDTHVVPRWPQHTDISLPAVSPGLPGGCVKPWSR